MENVHLGLVIEPASVHELAYDGAEKERLVVGARKLGGRGQGSDGLEELTWLDEGRGLRAQLVTDSTQGLLVRLVGKHGEDGVGHGGGEARQRERSVLGGGGDWEGREGKRTRGVGNPSP